MTTLSQLKELSNEKRQIGWMVDNLGILVYHTLRYTRKACRKTLEATDDHLSKAEKKRMFKVVKVNIVRL